MAQGDTDVTICSHALLLLGEQEISSFADGTTISGVCQKLYPDVRNMTLSMYPWSWARTKVQLQQLSSSPTNEWRYAYQMPADVLTGTPLAVFNTSSAGAKPLQVGWEIYSDQLLTEETTIYVDYLASVSEASMPSYFVTLLKYMMASHLAEVVTDQITKADYWRTLALGPLSENGRGGYFRQAMNIDGRGNLPKEFLTFPLTDVR